MMTAIFPGHFYPEFYALILEKNRKRRSSGSITLKQFWVIEKDSAEFDGEICSDNRTGTGLSSGGSWVTRTGLWEVVGFTAPLVAGSKGSRPNGWRERTALGLKKGRKAFGSKPRKDFH
jgi:hypothetical protein